MPKEQEFNKFSNFWVNKIINFFECHVIKIQGYLKFKYIFPAYKYKVLLTIEAYTYNASQRLITAAAGRYNGYTTLAGFSRAFLIQVTNIRININLNTRIKSYLSCNLKKTIENYKF